MGVRCFTFSLFLDENLKKLDWFIASTLAAEKSTTFTRLNSKQFFVE